jgi:hypothetical protein
MAEGVIQKKAVVKTVEHKCPANVAKKKGSCRAALWTRIYTDERG